MNDDRIQVFLTKRGTLVFRRPPRREPTPSQVAARERFAEVAQRAKGTKMTGDLPPAAAAVQREMAGRTFRSRPPELPWIRVLRSWLLDHGYTPREADAIVSALSE